MKNKMWQFSSVVTGPLEILMAEVAAGVITGHSTGDLFWKHETKYRGRKIVRGRIGNNREPKKGQDMSGDGHRCLRPNFILL